MNLFDLNFIIHFKNILVLNYFRKTYHSFYNTNILLYLQLKIV